MNHLALNRQTARWAIALTIPATLLSQTTATREAAAEGINLFQLVTQGGWAMYPLGLLLLALFALIFHAWQQTERKRFVPENALTDLSDKFSSGDLTAAKEATLTHPAAVTRLLSLALSKARPNQPDYNRPAMDQAFIDAAEGEENTVAQWINYLNVIATVAPMVGLLGTVSGMIGAFQKIGTAGMGKPEELAGNIGEALVTTASGLVIGIPAMIAYFYFRNRLSSNMLAVGQTGGLLLDYLTEPANDRAE